MKINNKITWKVSEIIGISDINAGTIYSIRFIDWVRAKFNIKYTTPTYDILGRSDINDLLAEFKSNQ